MNVTERAVQAARLLAANNNHQPDPTGTPEQRRAHCALELVNAVDHGLNLHDVRGAFLRADVACAVPAIWFPRQPVEQPQLALAI